VTIPKRTYPGDLARARFALARALRLTGGDAARVTELAEQARDDFASRPWSRRDAEAVRRWLAEKP
jgi:hypothetical protein